MTYVDPRNACERTYIHILYMRIIRIYIDLHRQFMDVAGLALHLFSTTTARVTQKRSGTALKFLYGHTDI